MSTATQSIPDVANAQPSAGGPRTPEGRAASSRNAITYGLFATRDFIRPGEDPLYDEFAESLNADLAPNGPLELNLVDEIRGAMWRLRRCRQIEQDFDTGSDRMQDPMQNEDTAKLQNSVDRARALSHRLLHKCTAELRKLQTERQFRNEHFEPGTNVSHLGICDFRSARKGVDEQVAASLRQHKLNEINGLAAIFDNNRRHVESITKQTPPASPQTPRNAPCPCGSGQ